GRAAFVATGRGSTGSAGGGRVGRRAVLLAAPGLVIAGRSRAAAPVLLRVGDQKGGMRATMAAAGVLDDLPFRLEWSQFPSAAPVLQALDAGAVDAAFAGDAPTTFAMAAGLRARIVAPVRSSGAGTAVVVPDGSPIRDAAGLKGRSVATSRGSIGHSLLLAVAASQGWPASGIRLVNLMPAEAKAALASGAVDAWSSWGVYVAQARLADSARVVVDGSGGLLAGLSYLVAGEDAIAARRAPLLEFCRRLAAARRWAQAHPAEYAHALAAEVGVTEAVARLTFDTDTPMPVAIDDAVIADEQRTADRCLDAGVIRERLDAGRMFDASFNEALGKEG
ncbi:MAG: aliphatic sulfonate ABC transporter substrate-binding protein, partial [Janthinobacterium lividum]